jgi:hypothetical protein
MLSSVGRAAVRRLALRPIAVSKRPGAASSLVARDQSTSLWVNSGLTRAFATRLVLQKEAATTTRKASATATKKKSAAKKKKPAAKSKKIEALAKEPKPKGRKKKELSPERQEKAALKALKHKALLIGQPAIKRLPENSWTVYLVENSKKGTGAREDFGSHSADVARSFKFLSSSEISVGPDRPPEKPAGASLTISIPSRVY